MKLFLDKLEAESGVDREPFEVELEEGQVVSLPHPKDMPFNALVNFNGDSASAVLRSLMGDEGFEAFANNPRVTLGILETVLNAYYAHFGLGSLPEGNASPTSSTGSARRSKQTSGSQRKAKAS